MKIKWIRAWNECVPVACLCLPFLLCKEGNLIGASVVFFVGALLVGALWIGGMKGDVKKHHEWKRNQEQNVCVKWFLFLRSMIRYMMLSMILFHLLKAYILPDVNGWLLAVPFSAILFYTMLHDEESFDRFSQVMRYRLLYPILFLMVLALFRTHVFQREYMVNELFVPAYKSGWFKAGLSGYAALFCLLPMENLSGDSAEKKERNKLWIKYIASVLLILALVDLLVGISSVEACGESIQSVFDNLQMISFPGNLFNRVDILLFGFFLYGFFVCIASYARAGVNCVTKQPKVFRWIMVAGVALAIILAALLETNVDWWFRWFLWFEMCIDLPIFFVIMILRCVKRRA